MDISVIIVNYNVKELLAECINSVLIASKNLAAEIIVVDNNSFDGSADYITNKFSGNPNVKVIASDKNLGFAKANNMGAAAAKGKYLLILNPDTILQEDTLTKCINEYENQPQMGALGCKLVLPSGRLDLACRRSFPVPSVALYRMLGLSKIFPKSRIFGKYNLTYLDEDKSYEVDAIVGAFMLIRKDVYTEVGGFDEDYFMYGEDLDLCFRIKKAGYKVYYFADTSIIHYKGESTKKSSISYVNNFYGAMQIFVKKNLSGNFWIVNLLINMSILYKAFMSYARRFLVSMYPAIFDIVSIVGGMLLAISQRFEDFPLEAYQYVIIIYTLFWLVSLTLSGSYKRANKLSFVKSLNGILIGFFVNSSFTYFVNEFAFSRVVVIRTALNAYVIMFIWRFLAKLYNYSKHRNILARQRKTLIVGRNEETDVFVSKLKKRVESEYDVIGFIGTNGHAEKGYVGNLNNLPDLISTYKIGSILFAKNVLSNQQVLDIMWKLRNYSLSFKILSSDSDVLLGKSALDKIDDIYLMQIEYNINKKFNIFVKRVFDLVLGIIALFTVFPVGLVLSGMAKSDERKGKFYRKLRLIPSVISGKLSFVGRATWDTSSYGMQYLGKRGLTGLVQINYYKNLTEDEVEYYNYYYAKNQTLTLDIEIILKTISLFIFKRNIPEL